MSRRTALRSWSRLAATALSCIAATAACAQQGPVRFGGYGPRYTPPVSDSRLPPAPQAEPHIQHLSVRCSEIAEGIRTGPSRGVSQTTIGELRREYQDKCGLEDQEARNRLSQKQAATQETRMAERAAAGQRQVAQAASVERCNNMRDTIALKRRREKNGELEPGDVANLRQFEAQFNAQCLGR